jgi:hypothetical protein
VLAGCGGGTSSPPDAADSATTTPRVASPLAQRYLGTWTGCLALPTPDPAQPNLRNRTTYTFTSLGGDSVRLESYEERFGSPDCAGTPSSGTRTEVAALTFDGRTFEVDVQGVGSVSVDSVVFRSQRSSLTSGFSVTLPGLGHDLQWGVVVQNGELRVTPLARLGDPLGPLIDGVLRRSDAG